MRLGVRKEAEGMSAQGIHHIVFEPASAKLTG
jgi:hypothetical protein